MLAVTYSRVRPEPPTANRTRSLPGLWHGDASGHHALVRETGSGQNAWVSFGKQGWVTSRERQRPVKNSEHTGHRQSLGGLVAMSTVHLLKRSIP
jgi:hypothetical protein